MRSFQSLLSVISYSTTQYLCFVYLFISFTNSNSKLNDKNRQMVAMSQKQGTGCQIDLVTSNFVLSKTNVISSNFLSFNCFEKWISKLCCVWMVAAKDYCLSFTFDLFVACVQLHKCIPSYSPFLLLVLHSFYFFWPMPFLRASAYCSNATLAIL